MAGSMLNLEEAQKQNYKTNLNAAEDIDFISKVINNKLFLALPDILYYYYEPKPSNKKLFQYYSHTLKKNFYDLFTFKLRFLKPFFISIIKTIYVTILIMFNRQEYLIKNRGNKANNYEVSKYHTISENINSNY